MKVTPFQMFASVLFDNFLNLLEYKLMRSRRLTIEVYATVSQGWLWNGSSMPI